MPSEGDQTGKTLTIPWKNLVPPSAKRLTILDRQSPLGSASRSAQYWCIAPLPQEFDGQPSPSAAVVGKRYQLASGNLLD
jgi:hypothetical protein